MQTSLTREFDIRLNGAEIETFRRVLLLGMTNLASSPKVQMSGSPLVRQAGLFGPDLSNVRTMFDQFSVALTLPTVDEMEKSVTNTESEPADEALPIVVLFTQPR